LLRRTHRRLATVQGWDKAEHAVVTRAGHLDEAVADDARAPTTSRTDHQLQPVRDSQFAALASARPPIRVRCMPVGQEQLDLLICQRAPLPKHTFARPARARALQ
jgi:hypothetical protein